MLIRQKLGRKIVTIGRLTRHDVHPLGVPTWRAGKLPSPCIPWVTRILESGRGRRAALVHKIRTRFVSCGVDHPAEKMSERGDHCKILLELPKFSFALSHSFSR